MDVEGLPVAQVQRDQDLVGEGGVGGHDVRAHALEGGVVAHVARWPGRRRRRASSRRRRCPGGRAGSCCPRPRGSGGCPRFLSAVTTLSSSSPTVLTQTWSTFLSSGAIQASRVPSGEIWGETFSGLPNSTSRGMSGGRSARSAAAGARRSASATPGSAAGCGDASTWDRTSRSGSEPRSYDRPRRGVLRVARECLPEVVGRYRPGKMARPAPPAPLLRGLRTGRRPVGIAIARRT